MKDDASPDSLQPAACRHTRAIFAEETKDSWQLTGWPAVTRPILLVSRSLQGTADGQGSTRAPMVDWRTRWQSGDGAWEAWRRRVFSSNAQKPKGRLSVEATPYPLPLRSDPCSNLRPFPSFPWLSYRLLSQCPGASPAVTPFRDDST